MAASQDARKIVAVCDLAGEESHTLTVPITGAITFTKKCVQSTHVSDDSWSCADGSVREGVLQLKVQLMAAVNAHMQAKNAGDAGDEGEGLPASAASTASTGPVMHTRLTRTIFFDAVTVDLMEEAVEDEGPGGSSAAGKAGRQKKRKQGGTKPAV